MPQYVFGLRAPHVSLLVENIADFISATIVGTLLATVFRWWAMRTFVYPNEVVPELLEHDDGVRKIETEPQART